MLGASRLVVPSLTLTNIIGLTLLALDYFSAGRDTLGAACFVLSLGFKQMALYYAPVIGTYLLGKCFYVGGRDG